MNRGVSHLMEDLGGRDPAWAGVRSETVEVRGHPVCVLRCDAAGPSPDAPLQVLVHGVGGCARNWVEVVPGLSRYGDVVAVDLPGFGSTRLPEGGSARVRANAGFVAAFLETLGHEHVVLHGSSMGGLIAAMVAARSPDRVAGLVLANPALPSPRRDMLRVPWQTLLRVIPTILPGLGRLVVETGFRCLTAERLVDESLRTVVGDPDAVRPAYRAAIIEEYERARREPWRRAALVEAMTSIVPMVAGARELNTAVDRIEAPTLLLWGGADDLVTRHVIDGLLARRPDWDCHVFPDVGHLPMVEVPDHFVDVVGGWLVRHHGRGTVGDPAPRAS